MENVQILTNYVRISERLIAGWRSESEVLEVWLAEARASDLQLESWGFKDGGGVFQSICFCYTFRHSTKSHYNLSKNMIQCKMFLFCFFVFFLHCDSSNIGKTRLGDKEAELFAAAAAAAWRDWCDRSSLLFWFQPGEAASELERGWRWTCSEQRGTRQQTTQTTVRLWRHGLHLRGGSGCLSSSSPAAPTLHSLCDRGLLINKKGLKKEECQVLE